MRDSAKFLPLKRFVDPYRPITYGIVQAGEDVDGGVPYIRPIDMMGHNGVPNPTLLRTTSPTIAAAYRRSTVSRGDIVISIGPSYGKTMEVPRELDGANLTQGTARVAHASGVNPRYLRWVLQAATSVAHWDAAVGGATFRALNLEPLSTTPIPSLPAPHQQAIADYLDAETSRIDALIAKKRRMIDLLEERPRASIDRLTIPRALGGASDEADDPWPVMALKHVARFFSDGDWIEAPFITTEGIRLIQTGNLGVGEFRDQGDRFITTETFRALRCTAVRPGDVLISRLGDRVGGACLAPDIAGGMVASVDVAILWPREEFNPSFLVAYLSSTRHLSEAALLARGSTMSRISRSQLGDMSVPAPARDVQESVVRKIQEGRAAADQAILLLRQQVRLLQEHRLALITAAVTGELHIPGVAA